MNKKIPIIVLVIALIIASVTVFWSAKGNIKNSPTSTITNSRSETSSANEITWTLGEDQWQANTTTLPTCPTPVLDSPVDLTNVTSILYPGQVRGGNYKPHGGFRFDQAANSAVFVTAPMNAVVVDGGRYLVNGEIQYTFDFMAPCGIMVRMGHLLELSPKFQAIAESFPAAQEGDSRTYFVDPQVAVQKGETTATKVGITTGGLNVFFDLGVYDMKAKNEASKDAAWAAKPEHDPLLAQRALCWFDLLSSADEARVRSLPSSDGTSGKTSDYCK